MKPTGEHQIPDKRTWHSSIGSFAAPTSRRKGAVPMWLLAQLKEREERLFIPQLYSSINDFFARWSMPMPRTGHWRLTRVEVGVLRACPRSQGMLVATDGIQCYIETGDKLFLGHLDNWQRFDFDNDGVAPTPKATPRTTIFDELKAEQKQL